MTRYESTSISFVSKSSHTLQNNQTAVLSQPQLSVPPLTNNFTSPRIPNGNTSKTCSNFLLICYSIFATLAALILTGISAYRMIIINNMTTTTTTITLPAQCFSYTTNSDATRAVRYASGSQNDNWMNTTTIWIRFTGAAGTEIVNWSPGGYNCDTTQLDGMFHQCHHTAVLLMELYAMHIHPPYITLLIQYTLPIVVLFMYMVLLGLLVRVHAIVLRRMY